MDSKEAISKASMPATITVKNPRVLEIVAVELSYGAGRNATEVAENLILAAAEARKLDRDRSSRTTRSGARGRTSERISTAGNSDPEKSEESSTINQKVVGV